jgi:hypothetical protein
MEGPWEFGRREVMHKCACENGMRYHSLWLFCFWNKRLTICKHVELNYSLNVKPLGFFMMGGGSLIFLFNSVNNHDPNLRAHQQLSRWITKCHFSNEKKKKMPSNEIKSNKRPNLVGAIIIKWFNNEKRLHHKWAIFEHLDFFIKGFFEGFFLQHVFNNIYNSPKKLHF